MRNAEFMGIMADGMVSPKAGLEQLPEALQKMGAVSMGDARDLFGARRPKDRDKHDAQMRDDHHAACRLRLGQFPPNALEMPLDIGVGIAILIEMAKPVSIEQQLDRGGFEEVADCAGKRFLGDLGDIAACSRLDDQPEIAGGLSPRD